MAHAELLFVEPADRVGEIGAYVAARAIGERVVFFDDLLESIAHRDTLETIDEHVDGEFDLFPSAKALRDIYELGYIQPDNIGDVFEAMTTVDPLQVDGLLREAARDREVFFDAKFAETTLALDPYARIVALADSVDWDVSNVVMRDGGEAIIERIETGPVPNFGSDADAFVAWLQENSAYQLSRRLRYDSVDADFDASHPVAEEAKRRGLSLYKWKYPIEWRETPRGRWPVVATNPDGSPMTHAELWDMNEESGAAWPVHKVKTPLSRARVLRNS